MRKPDISPTLKTVFSYVLALCILGGVVYLQFDRESWSRWGDQVQFVYLIPLAVLAFCALAVSGILWSNHLRVLAGKPLSPGDTILFPFARNLWNYIIPFQGSLAYALAFCKFKYSIQLRDNFAVNLYLTGFNFFLTGIVLLVYLITGNPFTPLYLALALLLTLNPLFVLVVYAILRHLNITGNGILYKLYRFIEQTVSGVKESMSDWRLALQTLILNVIHLAVTGLFIYTGGQALSFGLTFIQVLILAMVGKLSQLVKITPGNLGIEQLVYGLTMQAFGGDSQCGVAISLVNRFVTIVVVLLLGTQFTLRNLHYFKLTGIKALIRYLSRFQLRQD